MLTQKIGICVLVAAVLTVPATTRARDDAGQRRFQPTAPTGAVGIPYTTDRVHRVGNIGFCVTNYGFFGSQARAVRDPCTGLPAPSLEFPINSDVEYLFQGAMWVGAVKGKDTIVSVGTDGWSSTQEMYPKPYPEGDIITRTNRPILRPPPNSPCPDVYYSPDAVSEQDYIAQYSDTITSSQFVGVDPNDARGHIPLGIEVTQKSYSWSFDYAQDFILMEFGVRNVGKSTLNALYMGLYMDQDVGSQSGGAIYDDDIAGYTNDVPSPAGPQFRDTVNLAWIADNDGDPRGGQFYYASCTGVAGVRVVRAPTPDLKFSFNWWVSNGNAARDWGPVKRDSKVEFTKGNLGTPEGDKAKYEIMSNGEFDYDQVESAIDHSLDGWLPPVANSQLAADLADGFDTRYLLSFGPFDLTPDSTLPLTIAVVAGANFHEDPGNFANFFDPSDPGPYLANLNFTDFARNAQWAGWVYDTPGYDTDGNGYRGHFRIVDGDTAYYTGDGVPDYQGPPPPPPPTKLRFTTSEGKIIMRWNGEHTETAKDPFSLLADFEGYKVYMSRTLQLSDFALLTSRDNTNYVRSKLKKETGKWVVTDPPFSLDSLEVLYDSLSLATKGYPFHPDSFAVQSTAGALMEVLLDPVDPSRLDTNYYAFAPFGANLTPDDKLLAHQDSLTGNVVGVIRKLYPYITAPGDSVFYYDDGTAYDPFYEYEFAIDGLQLAEPVYLCVTAFDYGNPAADLKPLESSPLSNAEEVWPINSAQVVNTKRPKPGVYPNPYRLADDYNAAGWEDPDRKGIDPERARKVTFTNVPDTCTISIWTLDGDLVRTLDHAEDPVNSQASVVVWNLITRNTQAVKTGIYIYSIESRFGTDIGKLVIIK